jgi:hypothetical protein
MTSKPPASTTAWVRYMKDRIAREEWREELAHASNDARLETEETRADRTQHGERV